MGMGDVSYPGPLISAFVNLRQRLRRLGGALHRIPHNSASRHLSPKDVCLPFLNLLSGIQWLIVATRYLFSVILLALHFGVAIAQSSTTLVEGFTVFGPMVLTICTFLMALLFGTKADRGGRRDLRADEQDNHGENHGEAGISPAVIAMTLLGNGM